MNTVLHLDKTWQHIGTISTQRAMKKLIGGKSFPLRTDDMSYTKCDFKKWLDYSDHEIFDDDNELAYNRFPLTNGRYLAVPRILLSMDGIGHARVHSIACNRKNVLKRDNYICQYCFV